MAWFYFMLFFLLKFTTKTLFVCEVISHKHPHRSKFQQIYHRKPFYGYLKWRNFAIQRNCSLSPSYYEMIEKTLSPFRNSSNPNQRTITKEQILATRMQSALWPIYKSSHTKDLRILPHLDWLTFLKDFQNILPSNFQMFINMNDEPRVAPLNPSEHQTSYSGETYRTVSQLFKINQCFQREHLPHNKYNFSFFLSDDNIENVAMELLPIFTQSTHNCFFDLLIPTGDHFLGATNRYTPPQELTFHDWLQKKKQFVWRGSSHGVWWTSHTPYWQSQRHRFISLIQSLQHQQQQQQRENSTYKHLFNVSFSQYSTCEPHICNEMRRRYGPISFLSREDQRNTFRYVFDLDGAGWTNRFLPLLSDGMLIIKATYSWEYLSSFILPHDHYLPLDPNYEDLLKTIEWILSHDREVFEIVKRASKISQRRLRVEDLECYLSRMILEYSSLLRSDIPPFDL